MRISFYRSFATLLLAAGIQLLSAADFGYCTSSTDRTHIFSLGQTQKQGLAIRLPREKVAMLSGKSISSISAAFGSKRMTGGTVNLFIATAPDAEPLLMQTVAVSSATRWLNFQLDTPYLITGDEPELYIGYTGEISVGSTMLMGDFESDFAGASFAFRDGEWVDIHGMGFGNASIRFGIDDATLTDLIIKPLSIGDYFKAGGSYSFEGEVYNFGTETVTSFNLTIEVEDREPVTTRISDVSIAQNESYRFSMPEWTAEAEGTAEIRIVVANAGDEDPSDNVFAESLYFYPANMQRAILLEGFTGQACSNCPAGHQSIARLMQQATTPIVEVMHHSGYSPDNFSMDVDYDYTFFYGSPSTFAPAAMLNRTTIDAIGTVPVINTGDSFLQYAYEVVDAMQPYASLSLESEYNPATRQLDITFSTYAHTDLPSEVNVVNLLFVQDGLVANQAAAGSNYVHNAVCRGAITGNAWGVMMDEGTKTGEFFTWKKSMTLPEEIFSDYYNPAELSESQRENCTWPTDPEKMRIVAYVAAYGSTPSANRVYNAIEVPIGQSVAHEAFTASIDPLQNDWSPRVKIVNGRLAVLGEYDKLQLFSANGATVSTDSQLPQGVYIVKVSKGNATKTLKVCAR